MTICASSNLQMNNKTPHLSPCILLKDLFYLAKSYFYGFLPESIPFQYNDISMEWILSGQMLNQIEYFFSLHFVPSWKTLTPTWRFISYTILHVAFDARFCGSVDTTFPAVLLFLNSSTANRDKQLAGKFYNRSSI